MPFCSYCGWTRNPLRHHSETKRNDAIPQREYQQTMVSKWTSSEVGDLWKSGGKWNKTHLNQWNPSISNHPTILKRIYVFVISLQVHKTTSGTNRPMGSSEVRSFPFSQSTHPLGFPLRTSKLAVFGTQELWAQRPLILTPCLRNKSPRKTGNPNSVVKYQQDSILRGLHWV